LRADLVEWFESLPTKDKPAFLFDGEANELPDVSAGAAATADRAIAMMAWLLSENKSAMAINGHPNSAAIGEAVRVLAEKTFGKDVRGFASFHKRLAIAIGRLDTDIKAGLLGRTSGKN
jgi:hypothetical protein